MSNKSKLFPTPFSIVVLLRAEGTDA